MTTKITRWGNSYGVRIPRALLETIGLSDNDSVDIAAENKTIVLRPSRERLTLEKIFENWDGERSDYYDWGEIEQPVGRELI